MISLRDYQLEAIGRTLQAFATGLRRLLISLPTGTGKTVVFAELIRRRAVRALVLAHRDELISQAAAKVVEVWPEARLGVVKAERDDVGAPVVVASVQTLARPSRLARLLAVGRFATVVVDEAHHATADAYRDILHGVGSFDPGGPLTLGVTATAFRADGASLGDVFESVVYEVGILPMIERGYLADVRAKRIRLEGADFGFDVTRGDYAVAEVEAELLKADAPTHAAGAYLEHAAGRKALVFTPTVAVAHAMAEAFRARGVAAEAVDGSTPEDERRAILARFHSGETAVVANCAVLTEGFDEPSVSCVIVARPTRSKGLYCQMVGRGTRLYPGKADLLVLDLVGATGRHDLMTAAKLFDVPEQRLDAGRSVAEAAADVARDQALAAAASSQARRVAEDVDPFRTARLTWLSAGSGRFALSIGEAGTLILAQRGADAWDVVRSGRDRAVELVAAGRSLSYAQGVAEDLARRNNALGLARRDARWRSAPATPPQLEKLKRWRLPRPANMTRGEASDAISAYVARVAARNLKAVNS